VYCFAVATAVGVFAPLFVSHQAGIGYGGVGYELQLLPLVHKFVVFLYEPTSSQLSAQLSHPHTGLLALTLSHNKSSHMRTSHSHAQRLGDYMWLRDNLSADTIQGCESTLKCMCQAQRSVR
jgi:hypothetical protein